jgi:triosephosphate isomerase
MIRKLSQEKPIFEIGPKLFMHGLDAIKLAIFVDCLAIKHDVQIIFSAQYTDIREIAKATENIFVFSQHVDALMPGRGVGAVLPEALVEAGARGSLLNHVEKQMTLNELYRAIVRCKEVGLISMVCAESLRECVAIAQLGADAIIKESADMIGMANGQTHDLNNITATDDCIHSFAKDVIVLHGAGIKDENDVYDIIRSGAIATGATSAIFASADPFAAAENMIVAVRHAWDDRENANSSFCK